MAVYNDTRPHPGTRPATGLMHRLVADVLGRLAAWNDTRVTRNALSRLSDRELDDIGLTRSDIDRITR
ncbi:DUF1127 domain-containing protein [Rhodovulum euryhalinum]|uniref:Uncharacterized protein YjiS (DUF1127 family) n=1 Tax=Rhodovulum euryhalinum TaxID=35805 RepID=A0A4V2SAU0_9RHOB|nr:DUF1127 domain-containing protein [Rhodovulum euryhalinum]TCO72970.1 uncharacterized protein YjiS (DUF1127 family) [Rhodovulum euryhalinum]